MVFELPSLGQIFFTGAIGVALVGTSPLPGLFRSAGGIVGRSVGVLLGTRSRADKMMAKNTNKEISVIREELKSSMRELDVIRGEMASAVEAGRGIGGSGVEARRGRMERLVMQQARDDSVGSPGVPESAQPISSFPSKLPVALDAAAAASIPQLGASPGISSSYSHAVAAVVEEEWERQGIGFTSRAEKSPMGTVGMGGAASILSDIIRQGLVADQYDRAVATTEKGDVSAKTSGKGVSSVSTENVNIDASRK